VPVQNNFLAALQNTRGILTSSKGI